jgi:glutathione synthase
MLLKLGVVMDPIQQIYVKSDSSLALMLSAQQRGWQIYYMEQRDLFLRDGVTYARVRRIEVEQKEKDFYRFSDEKIIPLSELDVVLLRKDPPFDMEYIMTTYLLENLEQQGTLVLNNPQSLRDANEKMFINWFPQCCPPLVVAREPELLRNFADEYNDVVFKPLNERGGVSVFRVRKGDHNTNVIIETLTQNGGRYIMAQQFIPDVLQDGDKRIFLIDGEPFPYALARVPAPGEFRSNLMAGGQGRGVELNERERWVCAQVGPTLKEKGLLFVGLDVIGGYLTEMNVTSPTGIRPLGAIYNIDIAAIILDAIVRRVTVRK